VTVSSHGGKKVGRGWEAGGEKQTRERERERERSSRASARARETKRAAFWACVI